MPISNPNFVLFTVPYVPQSSAEEMLIEFMHENKLIDESTDYMIIPPGTSSLYSEALELMREQAEAQGFNYEVIDAEKARIKITNEETNEEKTILVVWTPRVPYPEDYKKWLH